MNLPILGALYDIQQVWERVQTAPEVWKSREEGLVYGMVSGEISWHFKVTGMGKRVVVGTSGIV